METKELKSKLYKVKIENVVDYYLNKSLFIVGKTLIDSISKVKLEQDEYIYEILCIATIDEL